MTSLASHQLRLTPLAFSVLLSVAQQFKEACMPCQCISVAM